MNCHRLTKCACALFLCSLLVLTGCVQVKSESNLKEDGSFQRDLTVVLMKEQLGDPEAKTDVFESVGLTDQPKWTTKVEEGEDKTTLTASRTFGPTERGATDYVLKWKEGVYLECKVNVKMIDGGLLEYTETYTWKGAPSEDTNPIDSKFKETIAAELKAANPTPEQLETLVTRVKAVVWQSIFGPGEPLLPVLLFDSQLAERKLRIAIYDALVAETARVFGDKMTEDARRDASRKIVKQFTRETLGDAAPPAADPSGPPPDTKSSEPISVMQAVVTGPGKLVETNGTYDPVEQQIYWSCYAQAAELGPLTFRAVFDPTP